MQRVPIAQVAGEPSTWNPKGSASNEPFRYIDISSIDPAEKRIRTVVTIAPAEAPSRARQLVRSGDVLVSTVRPNLNAVAVVPDDLDGATASTGFTVLRPDMASVDPRYLYYWVRSPKFVSEMTARATGASYPAVTEGVVRDSRLPLPPLAEQRRIAAVLDRADAIRRKRRESLRLLDEFLRSAFLEMFGDPVRNEKGWVKVSIGELLPERSLVVDGPFGSSLKPDTYVESGVRVIRNFNINDDHFDGSAFKYITETKFDEVKRSEVKTGDVLISTKGTLGNVCLMPNLPGNSVLSATGTVRIRLRGESTIRRQFFVSQMVAEPFKRYLKRFEAGTNQKYLNLAGIRTLEVVIPPVGLQDRYCELRARVMELKVRQAAALDASLDLFDSLAQRAFGGEL